MVDFSAAGSLLGQVYDHLVDLRQELKIAGDFNQQALTRVEILTDDLAEALAAGGGGSLPLAVPGADPSGLQSGDRGRREGDT
jgi:hypothetical protein